MANNRLNQLNSRIPREQITGDSKPQYSLYELVGLNINPYRGKSLDEYKEELRHMNFSDLQEHAITVGSVPIDDRERLENKLAQQYIIVNGQLQANAIQRDESEAQLRNSKKKSHQTKAQQKQVADLLARGR